MHSLSIVAGHCELPRYPPWRTCRRRSGEEVERDGDGSGKKSGSERSGGRLRGLLHGRELAALGPES